MSVQVLLTCLIIRFDELLSSYRSGGSFRRVSPYLFPRQDPNASDDFYVQNDQKQKGY